MTSVPPDDVDPQGLTAAEIPEGIKRAIRKHQEDTWGSRDWAKHRPRAYTTDMGVRPTKRGYYANASPFRLEIPSSWVHPAVDGLTSTKRAADRGLSAML